MAESKTVELSSTNTVVLRDMNMNETIMADGIAFKYATKLGEPAPSPAIVGKVYAACSVRELNGTPCSPVVSFAAFTSFVEGLTAYEGALLLEAYANLVDGDPAAPDSLKNEPPPPA